MRRGRLTPRKNFQPADDAIRALAEKHESAVALKMHGALKHLRTLVPVDKVAHALQHGNSSHVISAIAFDHYAEVLKEPIGLLGDVYEAAGRHGAVKLAGAMLRGGKRLRYRPSQFRKDVGDGFDFDRFDAGTQKRLRDLVDSLITDLGDSARDTINSVVIDGVRAGDSFDEIAANIRDTISLTPNQAQAVASYRRALEDLDSNALGRALRDTSFDSAIQDAIDSGEFLDDSLIQEAVDAYLENYLDHRASTIARTESLRAGNAGLRDSYTQAAERGVIPEAAVKRIWLIDRDERTCPICLSIIDMNPDGVGLSDDFESEDGPIDDPPVHPNCRCTVQYETDLDMVPDTPVEEEAA
jgi:hypothetical protein